MESTPVVPPATSPASASARPYLFGLVIVVLLALGGVLLWPRLFPAVPAQPLSSVPAPEVGHPAPDFTPPTFFIDPQGIIREIRVGGPLELDFLQQQARQLSR